MPSEAFDLIRETDLSEYRSVGRLYRHRATGLEAFHVANDDPENLFAFSFRTIPEDSSGVAHILEHSVLCGSRRYPVKDAFIVASQGSLNTYMNALTFPDRTVYPAASALEADYFNLMGVYADAVFFPRLDPEVFLQEGHRLVPTASGGAEIQGVVYSEMLGNYSSPEGILDDKAFRSLFDPGHPYAFDSGGDPAFIPALTYEGLLAFHARHYHPSNCRLFLYGNLPAERQLSFLDREFLSGFAPSRPVPPVPLQEPFSEPRRLEVPYPGDQDGKTSVLTSWLCADASDPAATLSMEVLGEILLGHDGSPLGRSLRESGLGEDLSPQSGISTETRQAAFQVGLRGIRREDAQAVESLAMECLASLSSRGVPAADLDAALKSVEFSNREIRRGGGPYSLRLMRRCLRGWTHGAAPEACLRYRPAMAELRGRLESDKRYFEKLIERVLLSNPHRSTVIAYPDPGLGKERAEGLDRLLRSRLAAMDREERDRLDSSLAALAEFHGREDDPAVVATIPHVKAADLPTVIDRIERVEIPSSSGRIIAHPLFSNGISYLDIAFDIRGLDPALLPWMPLFSRFITTAGLPGIPYHQVNSRLASCAGGFSCVLEASSPVSGTAAQEPGLYALFRLKALDGSFAEALSLAGDLISGADSSDAKRLQDVFTELKNDVQAALVPSAHAFAQSRSASSFSRALSVEEAWRGLDQHDFLQRAALNPGLVSDMAGAIEAIKSHLLRVSARLASLTCDDSAQEASLSALAAFLRGLPEPRPSEGHTPLPLATARDEAISLQTEVGYASAVLRSAPIDARLFPALSVLSTLLSTSFLWEEIRMKQGAYGAWASQDPMEGIFAFLTYRDPRPADSLEAFRAALESVAREAPAAEAAEKALVGTVANDLRPLTPEEKGLIDLRRALYGLDDGLRQRKRAGLLGVTPEALREAASFLLDGWGSRVQTVIAGAEEADRAAAGSGAMSRRALSS